jgi:excisionase family DNA binding protein
MSLQDLHARSFSEALGEPASSSAAAPSAVLADHDEALRVDDVARLLRVGRNSVYALVGSNQIPHRRIGKQIRFSRAAVMRWLTSWSLQGAKKGQ